MSPILTGLMLLAAPDATDVKATMRGNLAAVVALQPLLASPEAFADPANAPTLSSSLATLGRMRHQFLRPNAQEPAVALGELFSGVVTRARADFDAGRPDVARRRLKGLTSLCLSCHSRQVSPQDFAAAGKAADGAGLKTLERATFLAATRQFDAALALWGDALASPRKTDADFFEQTQALRSALNVVVRAKDDPKATVALLDAWCQRPDLASWTRHTCERELADAKGWAAEGFTVKGATARQLFDRAGVLIDAAGANETLFPREEDRVKLLRASAYLSLALEREPKASWRGEALYRLGLVTAATLDPDLWELDALYLEACVRENPHSALGARCIERLSDRTIMDYTGSGGTRLPADVAAHLEQLRALAK